MLEHWEGGPGSGAAEVWVSFFGKCKPKESCQVQLLLSTLPALPTLAQKETGFTQTSRRPEVANLLSHFPEHVKNSHLQH